MKKLFLALAVVAPMLAAAQVLEVQSLQKINTPQNVDTKIAGVSPAGDYILLTTVANEGLIRYDLATGETKELSNAPGAGYNVKVSRDGKEIVHQALARLADNHGTASRILNGAPHIIRFALNRRKSIAQLSFFQNA